MNDMVMGVRPSTEGFVSLVGLVKWFDKDRGYGFVIPENGMEDVLLHLSVLKRDGFGAPLEGTRITFEAVQRKKGLQCMRVLEVDPSIAIHPVKKASRQILQPTTGWMKATVKWFNRARGFGFVYREGREGDVFLHMEIVRKGHMDTPEPDQVLWVKCAESPKGLQATDVCLEPPGG